MTIQTIENLVKTIASQVLDQPIGALDMYAPVRHDDMTRINDATCMALNLNISTLDATQHPNLGRYVQMVQEERSKQ